MFGTGIPNKSKYYVKQIDNDTYGTLAFPMTSFQQKGHIFVSCLVGVSYRPLEELFNKYGEFSDSKAIYPTLSKQIGYYTPEKKFFEWDYSDQVNPVELFDEIKNTIIEYGYPFFWKYSNPEELMNIFQNEHIGASTVSLTTGKSILYYLKGDKEEALKCLDIGFKDKKYNNASEERFDKNFRKLLLL